jgi:signal transduction histidine kinase
MTVRTISASQLDYLLLEEKDSSDAPDTPYNSPLLRLFVSADREVLSQSFTELHCHTGEIIFAEGEAGDTMFLIRSGRVAIVKGDLAAPSILAYRGAGDIIGEMALLENQPRSATVIALEQSRLLGISRQRFEQLLAETPSAGRSIMEMLSSRLRRLSEARSTGELSEKRLSQQVSALESERQRLEALQRLRQETTDLIVHDLRNPLSAIAVALKMMSFVLPDEILQANEELLNIAQASVDRMQRLVDSLLEVSRMESGETQFTFSKCHLGPLLEDVARRSAILARKGVQMRIVVSPDLPPVSADRDKLERVVANLVDNAVKYTPEFGLIRLAAAAQGAEVLVSISDTGPGIPAEERQRIFERFTQVAGEKAHQRGFGLGLAYCRLAVERHGGRIWVEPGLDGVGSCFLFTLPVAGGQAS